MIRIRQLRYTWPRARHAVLAIDHLDLEAGRSHFVHGPSGCGKSTLLGLLAGVLVPSSGELSLMGIDWATLSGAGRDARRADHVGYIFQQFNLLPWLSALDNVRLPCRFSARRLARAKAQGGAREQAESLLARVGIAAADHHRPAAALSVGQQQRVAAARALIGAPELLIADEPTSSLDARLRDTFMDLLLGECATAGSTLVFVSHDERLAARFDHVISLPGINAAALPA